MDIEVNSIAWLYRRAQPKDSIHYITLHYIYTSESDQVKLLDMKLITSNINLKYSEISIKGSTYKPRGL